MEDQPMQKQEEIHAAQIELLFSDAHLGILVSLINAVLLSLVQWDHVPHSTLVGWLACVFAVLMGRWVLIRRYHAIAPKMPQLRRWGLYFTVGSTITAVGWGLAGILLVPASSLPHQIFTTFVLGGMAAAAMTTLSAVFPCYLLYLLNATVPVTVVFFHYGDTIHVMGAVMMVLYMVFLFHAGRRQNRFIRDSVNLTLDKGELAGRLASEKRQAEALNASLTQEIALRARADSVLKYRLELEEQLTAISTGFINLPVEEIDGGINRALEQLGAFAGADRGYVFLLSPDRSVYRNTHAWSVEGVGPTPEPLLEIDANRFPWWMGRLEKLERVRVARMKDLPPKVLEEYESFHPQPVQSLALVPLVASGVLTGFLGFESFRQENIWGEETEALLNVIADMFVNALERKRSYEALEQARMAAEAAAAAKARFLANMSHEIRTPLHGVLGILSLLRNGELPEREMNYVDVAHSSAEMLLNIIDDILDFSRIEAGRLHLEEKSFRLSEVVEDSVALLARQAAVKELELACFIDGEVPDNLRGDAARLRQVLVNLVGNAVKFTHSGEVSVQVTLDSQKESEAFVRFEVRDTGIGIAPEAVQEIFDPFIQADPSTTRQYGGTGLGLAISRQLVELMGGEMGVASEPGRGSTFWFRIGFAFPSVQVSETPGVLYELHLLLVAARKTTRSNLSRYMESWGVRLQTAEDPGAAEKIVAAGLESKDPFDVVLMDTRGNGDEELALARRIQSQWGEKCPFTVILASIESEDLLKQDPHVDAVLPQPVRRAQLYETLVHARQEVREAAADARTMSGASGQAEQGLPHPRVLLVEDNPINQRLGQEMLTILGYEAAVASNGRICLEMLEQNPYDLILMDCQMPEMDGYAATRAIRRREGQAGSRKIPIVALTANAMHGDRERCLECGMDDYIAKPFTLQNLRETLAHWLPRPGC